MKSLLCTACPLFPSSYPSCSLIAIKQLVSESDCVYRLARCYVAGLSCFRVIRDTTISVRKPSGIVTIPG